MKIGKWAKVEGAREDPCNEPLDLSDGWSIRDAMGRPAGWSSCEKAGEPKATGSPICPDEIRPAMPALGFSVATPPEAGEPRIFGGSTFGGSLEDASRPLSVSENLECCTEEGSKEALGPERV